MRISDWSSDVCSSDLRYLVVRDRDGGLHAWFACETREQGLHVLDFRSRRGADGPSRTAVAILLRIARADGHASVSVALSAAAATGPWPSLGLLAREGAPVSGRWCTRDRGGQGRGWVVTVGARRRTN